MLRKIPAIKVWSRFPVKNLDDSVMNMQIMDLCESRFEEFIDFYMNYYVRREITHIICGLPASAQAMKEYREIVRKRFKNQVSPYTIVVCCPENLNRPDSKIIGFSGVNLVTKENADGDNNIVQPKTREVKKLFELEDLLKRLSPIHNLMKIYGVKYFHDDLGLAIHPEYYKYGIATELIFSRRKLCTVHGVPMGGSWVTTPATAKAGLTISAETVLKIDPEELCKTLGLKKIPSMIYKALDERSMNSSIRFED